MSTRRVSDIIQLAANMARVSYGEVIGTNRSAYLVRIRRAVVVVARDKGHSYAFIGSIMRKDHSTVLHSYRAAHDHMEHDPQFRSFVDDLSKATIDSAPFVQPILEEAA